MEDVGDDLRNTLRSCKCPFFCSEIGLIAPAHREHSGPTHNGKFTLLPGGIEGYFGTEGGLSCRGFWGPCRATQGGWREYDAVAKCCNSTNVVHRCYPPGLEKRPSHSNLIRGDQKDCNNYRGITLLSVPSEVFAGFVLNRIRDHLWY